jgi:hypothetical protein
MAFESVFSLLVLFTSYLVLRELIARRQFPKGVPWVGKTDWIFPKTRAGWRGVVKAKELVIEGYNKVGYRI